MSRTLSSPICFLSAVVVLCGPVFAQNPGRARVGSASKPPATQKTRLPAQKITPQLKQVLEDWYQNTRTIKKLEGQHYKFDYEMTFNVETRGTGRFYYESPDRGRIDIEPTKIPAGAKSNRLDSKTNKPFALMPAKQVKWLSTGKTIYKVLPGKKRAFVYPIPPANRGVNIMDGPLPFLLGMPPAKALQRFVLQIDRNTKTEVWLTVWPRWRTDRANYAKATIILVKTNHYLPRAVQLVNLGRETVYTFFKMEVNKKGPFPALFGRRDPFKIDLRAYKIESGIPKNVAKRESRPANVKRVAVPDVSRMPYKQAQQKLRATGLNFSIRKGSIAANEKYAYYVERQSPPAKTLLPAGQKVVLVLYVKASDLKPKGRTAARPTR